jgi:hypothetical protein
MTYGSSDLSYLGMNRLADADLGDPQRRPNRTIQAHNIPHLPKNENDREMKRCWHTKLFIFGEL